MSLPHSFQSGDMCRSYPLLSCARGPCRSAHPGEYELQEEVTRYDGHGISQVLKRKEMVDESMVRIRTRSDWLQFNKPRLRFRSITGN